MQPQHEYITLGDVMDVLWGFVVFDVILVFGVFYLILVIARKRDGDQ